MKMLRQENAQITHRGAQFNLIGVDYQRERNNNGHRTQMLDGMDSLIRRDMPNILLSHNPNSFNRAAELGIELSLAGHTHGGQIQVEILDHRLSPARFISDYVAGYFQRPLFAPSSARMVNPSTHTDACARRDLLALRQSRTRHRRRSRASRRSSGNFRPRSSPRLEFSLREKIFNTYHFLRLD